MHKYGKAGRMTTSAGQLVELNGINCFIVRILGNRIAKISIYRYHKHVRMWFTTDLSMRQESSFGRGDFCCFIYKQQGYDKTRRYWIKQSGA